MLIEVKNILKKYGKKAVLVDLSFQAKSGECIGIVGANGCGKSTLLSILAGIQRADQGSFLYDGKDLFSNHKMHSRAIGYVPQGTPLIEELSAYDNLLLWYDKSTLKKELSGGMLSTLGINEFIKVRVSKMSGGMKKRLSIGCALAGYPPILLLDEPMSALDIACKQKIQDYLKEYKRSGGIIVLVTHDVPELQLCDSCFILKSGKLEKLELSGDTNELVNKIL